MAERPPNAAEIVSLVEERLRAVAASPGLTETVRVVWRDGTRDLPVITMPVGMLYYNPETHRIRAQRGLDPERSAAVTEAPWSEASQQYLNQLLMGDPSDPLGKVDPTFTDLKEDLRVNDQREPGIITRDGILVNANTRCAALRELGKEHIRVGVLEPDADWTDIASVELNLQLAKEFRRDYSFINELLAIDELAAAGKSDADIARLFRRNPKTIQRSRWILEFINDCISQSTDVSGSALRLVDFERDKAQLEELHRRYWQLHASDTGAAERMKAARAAAVALNLAKTEIRAIDSDFVSRILAQSLPARLAIAPEEKSIAVPGLDVNVEPPGAAEKALAAHILKTRAVSQDDSATPEARSAAAAQVAEYKEAFRAAAERAQSEQKHKARKAAVPEHILAANDAVERAIDEVVANRANAALLDVESIDLALSELRDSVARLAQNLKRSNVVDGDALAWLMMAAAIRNE